MELTGFNTLTYDLLKYLIQFDLEIAIMLCQAHPDYRAPLIKDENLWRNYFHNTWFPLLPKDNSHAKCIKFLHNPIVLDFNLLKLDWIQDWSNIVVAGGYVVNAVMNDTDAMRSGDIDIFFINDKLTQQDVVDKIKLLHSWMKVRYSMIDIHVKGKSVKFTGGHIESNGCFTSATVQIIFMKLFSSVHDVITSFDLPNCGFAYQGDFKLYYTESGLEYYRTGIIYYFNPKKCSRRQAIMEKYKELSYNTIQPIKKCLIDCS